MKKLKYITDLQTLIRLNNAAIMAGRNRTLRPETITKYPEACYPISWSMLHNDMGEIRCKVVLNAEGAWALLDMDITTYEALPEMEIPND